MIDTNQLSALISAFRVETEKESISPETVGKLLQDGQIVSQVIQKCGFFLTKTRLMGMKKNAEILAFCLDNQRSFFSVGMTRFELATPRPPDYQ